MALDTVAQLLDLPRLRVLAVDMTPTHLTITVASDAQVTTCPQCQARSWRVHSHYQRTVLDLNWGVRTVTLLLQVRRFVCKVQACLRKIFTERLPKIVAPYARRAIRLRQELEDLACELGGEAGTRLAQRLRYGLSSADTLLRLIRNAPPWRSRRRRGV